MTVSYGFNELLNKERLLKAYNPPKWTCFIGLTITGCNHLAIKGGESTKDFHVTLLYGYFDPFGHDEDHFSVCIQSAIDAIRDLVPDTLKFDAIGRFEASKSSDGKDVIYAQVAKGQLEHVHEKLIQALLKNGVRVEKTFPDYHPHMTLAYIDSEADYPLHKLDETGTIKDFVIGFGENSSSDNNYHLHKANPYHDRLGRFTTGPGGGSGTSAVNSNGQNLSPAQQEYFKNSKARDEKGNLAVVYHTSPDDGFEVFDRDKAKGGFFFSDNFATSTSYQSADSSHVYNVYLNLENPLIVDCKGNISRELSLDKVDIDIDRATVLDLMNKNMYDYKLNTYNWSHIAEQAGRDGVIFRNIVDNGAFGDDSVESNVYVAFRSNQVKDVSNTNPTDGDGINKNSRCSSGFLELLNKAFLCKFNPYHDRLGRFANADGAASFTFRTKNPEKQHMADKAVEREKERQSALALAPTEAQEKSLNKIANRTRNLKKEQLSVVDSEGNVIMHIKGTRGEVNFTVGDARDNFPGNITIHNHPDGGTFSAPDLTSLGYGAKEIRVAAPEGDYILKAAKTHKSGNPDATGWYDMRTALEDAENTTFKNHFTIKKEAKAKFQADYDEKVTSHAKKWLEAKDKGASQEEQQKYIDAYNKAQSAWEKENRPKIEQEVRNITVGQYHEFYTANASKYGLEYKFIPCEVKKGLYMSEEFEKEIEKSENDGIISLDAEFNKTMSELADAILNDLRDGND